MLVVGIPPFIFLIDFDENFFVHPRLDSGIRLVIALKFKTFLVAFIQRILLIILHQKPSDFQRTVFHSLDIKIDLGADLMF